jgi:hypothetical protein
MRPRYALALPLLLLTLAACPASTGPSTGPTPAETLREQSARLLEASADHTRIPIATLAALERREVGNEEAKAIAETALRLTALIEGARFTLDKHEADVSNLATASAAIAAIAVVNTEIAKLRTLADAAGVAWRAP